MPWSKLSCLRTCPSHLCFLNQIIFYMLLVSLARTNTSSFVTFSVQLIFSILHISTHFKFFQQLFNCSALVNVQVSAAYSATFQTALFIICFFCWQLNFPVNNFLLSMNNVLHVAILARISLVAYPSSDIQLPKYLKWLTCSTCWSSINRHTLFLPSRYMHDLCFLHIDLHTTFLRNCNSIYSPI